MGSLSNLYISQSFQSLIHLGNDISASTTQVELQDGLGNGLGIFVNTLGDVSIDGALIVSGTFDIEGKITVNDDVRVNGNLSVSGATSLTGSLDVTQTLTASAALIENDLIVSGTLYANKVVTIIESSSVIYSSGSNILGDELSDTQTLIGTTIISGSGVLSGSMSITNDLSVTGNISSSTISGIGNVTLYSQSVDSRLVYIETTFSTSVDNRLDYLEGTFSQSVDSRLDVVEATASLYLPFSTSVDFRLDQLEAFSSSLVGDFVTQAELAAATGSLINQINTKLNTSSFNAYTQSNDTAISNLSSSVSTTFGIVNGKIDGLSAKTGSYATTGSNFFAGNQVFSGSVKANVVNLSISAQTASMDLASANFFTITLVSGSNTHISATGGTDGETISLKVTQPVGAYGTVSFSPNVKFPQAFPYIPTPSGSAVDILSFQTYDTSFVYGVAVNTMR